MTEPLFTDADERQAATVLTAGVVLHALVTGCEANGGMLDAPSAMVKRAFSIAEAFIAEAEARCAPPATGELMHVSV